MSRQIDTSDPSKLSDEDKQYLFDRNRLPAGVEFDPTAKSFEEDSEPATPVVDDEDEIEDEEEDEEEEDLYEDLNVDELKKLLRDRDLPVGGNRDELLARLRADDEEE